MNCPSCQNDTLTHHGRTECSTCGYVDDRGDSSPPSPDAPLACPRCSRSIRPGTGRRLSTGKTVHVRCLTRRSRNPPVRLQAESQAVGGAAADVAQRSPSLTDPVTWVRTCAVCGKGLNTGGGLLFQGDRLVHALCWG